MEGNYTYSNISNINISFLMNEQSNDLDSIANNDILKKDSTLNKSLKRKFPKNKIFRINSLIFNPEKQCNELCAKYDCIYDEKHNSLYLIINGKNSHDKFAKNRLINIIEFSLNVEIDFIYLLINKANKQYINIIQDMMIVGFKCEENLPCVNIDGNVYKRLKMSIKDISNEIKEISFI